MMEAIIVLTSLSELGYGFDPGLAVPVYRIIPLLQSCDFSCCSEIL